MATKTKTKTKTKTDKKKTSAKKPSWDVVTFRQIEARRVELNHSKASIAEALGVTNSTFHNWQRGTTVPHVNQQEQIKAALDALTPRDKAAAQSGASKSGRKVQASPKPRATTESASKRLGASKLHRTVPKRAGDVGGGNTQMQNGYTNAHPYYPTETPTVRGVAQITAAWISSQGPGLSAGSVYEFASGIKKVLKE